MSRTGYKNLNEDFNLENLEASQRHILTSVYKNKIREFINNAMDNGDDVSIDEEGNILSLQIKYYTRKYEWDHRIQDFVKVCPKSRRVKRKTKQDVVSKVNTQDDVVTEKVLVDEME